MARRLTILVVVLSWRTAHALVCRAPAMAAAPTRASAVLMADVAPDHDEKVAKALKAMTGFANSYCKNTGTTYCEDLSIPAVRYSLGSPAAATPTRTRGPALGPTAPHAPPQVVLKGLAEHKVTLGAPLCPCRHYEDKEAEAKDGFWNCPCVPMRERHDCHCMCAPAIMLPPLPRCHARAPATPCGSAVPPHARHTEAEQGVRAGRRLFLTEDNEFAGPENHVDVEEVKRVTDGMSIL